MLPYGHIVTHLDVPDLASSINGSTDTKIWGIVKLTARYLSLVATKSVDASAVPNIPNLDRIIKTARDDSLALCIEIERNDLSCVAQEGVQTLSAFHIPEPWSVVHRPCGHHGTVRIEWQTYYFCCMTPVGMISVVHTNEMTWNNIREQRTLWRMKINAALLFSFIFVWRDIQGYVIQVGEDMVGKWLRTGLRFRRSRVCKFCRRSQ